MALVAWTRAEPVKSSVLPRAHPSQASGPAEKPRGCCFKSMGIQDALHRCTAIRVERGSGQWRVLLRKGCCNS